MKGLFKKVLAYMGYVLTPLPAERVSSAKALAFEHFLDLYFAEVDPQRFFFIQIGAHDGRHRDPLHAFVVKYRLRGLALEPQPDIFARLRDTYREYPEVTCVNAAVGEQTGQRPFFTVVGDSSLATFDRSVLSPYEGRIQESVVDVTTLDDLVNRYGVKTVDFLQIDCEGYDAKILQAFDWHTYRPRVVNYESILLSADERRSCEGLLRSHGYTLFNHGYDTCAYRL